VSRLLQQHLLGYAWAAGTQLAVCRSRRQAPPPPPLCAPLLHGPCHTHAVNTDCTPQNHSQCDPHRLHSAHHHASLLQACSRPHLVLGSPVCHKGAVCDCLAGCSGCCKGAALGVQQIGDIVAGVEPCELAWRWCWRRAGRWCRRRAGWWRADKVGGRELADLVVPITTWPGEPRRSPAAPCAACLRVKGK
jgi:hypothetical protein